MSIEGHQPFEREGTFVATGAGLCPSGTNTSHSVVTERASGALFDVTKTFTCHDGSGTFDMHVDLAYSGGFIDSLRSTVDTFRRGIESGERAIPCLPASFPSKPRTQTYAPDYCAT